MHVGSGKLPPTPLEENAVTVLNDFVDDLVPRNVTVPETLRYAITLKWPKGDDGELCLI